MVGTVPRAASRAAIQEPASDPEVLAEAVAEAARRIAAARRPVILAGVEIHRFGLQDRLLALAEGAGIPIATTMLGKSVVSEPHPLFVGIYEGAMGREEVTRFVEESDCVIMLGDLHDRHQPGHLHRQSRSGQLHLRHQRNAPHQPPSFRRRAVGRLHRRPDRRRAEGAAAAAARAAGRRRTSASSSSPTSRSPSRRLIARLNQSLDDSMVVIADPGDALFASSDLVIQRQTEFLSPAYYTSMGFAVPAALGVHGRPARAAAGGAGRRRRLPDDRHGTLERRPPRLQPDRHRAGQRGLRHGAAAARRRTRFNDIHPWQYHKLPELLGGGTGYEVRTEGQFDAALRAALADTRGMSLIQVHLDPHDCSTALQRLADRLRPRVGE